ncbi:DivIVA domain-containing protein [Actinacidiphila sp. bgisy167]|uniref:DivIVA domain-containing protein n=1 Tax=Actinacidiphila sp. bgisy167 TaxID=3413797 RepID=UPI003D7373C7
MAQTPITPENVRTKQFTTVRLREAYDEREVDDFLDEVRAELTRLLKINQDLRTELSAAEAAAARQPERPEHPEPAEQPRHGAASGPEPAAADAAFRYEPGADSGPRREPAPERKPAPRPAAEAAASADGSPARAEESARQAEEAGPKRSGIAVDSSARLMALAERTAEQAVSEARAEAHKIVGEALGQADALRRDARDRAQALEQEAREKHRQAMVALASARTALQRKVDDLRTFEHAYRSRLTAHMQSQLRRLDRDLARSLAPPVAPPSVSLARATATSPADARPAPPSPAHASPASPASPGPGVAPLTTAGTLSGEED